MRTSFLLLLLVLAGCKGHEAAVSPATATAPAPDWVRSRPVSDVYYIGIGGCSKTQADYQEGAKKLALNDLANEITVTVEGNSLLYTLERTHQFEQQYTSSITTRSSAQLEGYELVDSWDSGTEQWLYYRLSKAEYARIKAEKKAQAMDQAKDHHTRSAQSLAAGDLKGAFDQDLRALLAIKDYWGESDGITMGDKQVPFANQLFAELQQLTSGVRFTALPERCTLDNSDHFKREMLITATYEGGTAQRYLAQLPLVLFYPGNSGRVTENKNSDAEGHARTTVQRVDLDTPAPELVVQLDVNALVSPGLEPAFTKPLIGSLTVPELHVPIDRVMPRVYIHATEANMGQPVGEGGVAVGIKQELTTKGFRFVDRAGDADLLLELNSATRQGGEANGFYTAYLDVTYSFRDRRTNEVVLEGSRPAVKGIQMDYTRAGLDAYKRAGQDLRKELVTAMLNALL